MPLTKRELDQIAKNQYSQEIFYIADIDISEELRDNVEDNISYQQFFQALSTSTTIKLVHFSNISFEFLVKWQEFFINYPANVISIYIEEFQVGGHGNSEEIDDLKLKEYHLTDDEIPKDKDPLHLYNF